MAIEKSMNAIKIEPSPAVESPRWLWGAVWVHKSRWTCSKKFIEKWFPTHKDYNLVSDIYLNFYAGRLCATLGGFYDAERYWLFTRKINKKTDPNALFIAFEMECLISLIIQHAFSLTRLCDKHKSWIISHPFYFLQSVSRLFTMGMEK